MRTLETYTGEHPPNDKHSNGLTLRKLAKKLHVENLFLHWVLASPITPLNTEKI